jgi:Mg-chelatase subunit ChlD
MNKAVGPRVVLVVGVVLAALPFGPDSLLAQSRRFRSGVARAADGDGHRPSRPLRADLTEADLAIFEEGRRQAISHFASADAPIDMGFLPDTSGSMRDNLHLAQNAARGLVRQLRAGARGAVAGMGSTVSLHQPMTSDLPRVDESLRSTQASGSTALYDALYVVLRQYQQRRQSFTEVRRQVVVLLSDGIDTSSHVTFEDVLDLVRRVEATIYVVSLGEDPALLKNVLDDRNTFESARALRTLAGIGGTAVHPAHGARTARDLRCHRRGAEPTVRDRVPAESGSRRDVSPHLSAGAAAPRRSRAHPCRLLRGWWNC